MSLLEAGQHGRTLWFVMWSKGCNAIIKNKSSMRIGVLLIKYSIVVGLKIRRDNSSKGIVAPGSVN